VHDCATVESNANINEVEQHFAINLKQQQIILDELNSENSISKDPDFNENEAMIRLEQKKFKNKFINVIMEKQRQSYKEKFPFMEGSSYEEYEDKMNIEIVPKDSDIEANFRFKTESDKILFEMSEVFQKKRKEHSERIARLRGIESKIKCLVNELNFVHEIKEIIEDIVIAIKFSVVASKCSRLADLLKNRVVLNSIEILDPYTSGNLTGILLKLRAEFRKKSLMSNAEFIIELYKPATYVTPSRANLESIMDRSVEYLNIWANIQGVDEAITKDSLFTAALLNQLPQTLRQQATLHMGALNDAVINVEDGKDNMQMYNQLCKYLDRIKDTLGDKPEQKYRSNQFEFRNGNTNMNTNRSTHIIGSETAAAVEEFNKIQDSYNRPVLCQENVWYKHLLTGRQYKYSATDMVCECKACYTGTCRRCSKYGHKADSCRQNLSVK